MDFLWWIISLIGALGGTAGIVKLCQMYFRERGRRIREAAKAAADKLRMEMEIDENRENDRREQYEYFEARYRAALKELENKHNKMEVSYQSKIDALETKHAARLEKQDRECDERLEIVESKCHDLERRCLELQDQVGKLKMDCYQLNLKLAHYENNSSS